MMPHTMSLISSPLTDPVLQRQIDAPILVDMRITEATSVDRNSRAMLTHSYDIGEMSLGTFIAAVVAGQDFCALPIFTGRRFVHSGIALAPSLATVEDLPGHRVAVPQFWMTSSIWHRELLRSMYGIPTSSLEWTTTASERLDHLSIPSDLAWQRAPNGSDPKELLQSQTVDAVLMPRAVTPSEGWHLPFESLGQAEVTYWKSFGVFPIMHMVVIQGSLYRNHPDLVPALIDLFEEAKRMAERSHGPLSPFTGIAGKESREITRDDLWTFGWEANRTTFHQFWHGLQQDGLIAPDKRWEEWPVWID